MVKGIILLDSDRYERHLYIPLELFVIEWLERSQRRRASGKKSDTNPQVESGVPWWSVHVKMP